MASTAAVGRYVAVSLFKKQALFFGLVSVAEDTQQVEEEVDEVEVEVEGADGGEAADRVSGCSHGHCLNLLCVPGGEADEDEHAGVGDDPHHRLALDEEVDEGGDDDAEQGHEEYRAHAREVVRSEIAVDAHGGEGAGGYEECRCYRLVGVGEEYRRQGQAVDGSEDIEEQRGHGVAEFIDSGCDGDDNADLGNEQAPHEPRVVIH